MITSRQNPKIQHVRSLLGQSKYRDVEKSFVIEGVRLGEEALNAGISPRLVLFTTSLSHRGMEVVNRFISSGSEVEEISDQMMEWLSATETSQGLLAVLPMVSLPLPDRPDFILIADSLQDPGNLGTLLRTAAAAQAQAVLLGPGTTDPFAPKVVRSAMGAHFHLPVLSLDWPQIELSLKRSTQPLHVFLADPSQGLPCWQADLRQPCALLIGNEAKGASQAGRQLADDAIHIPMHGKSESLNAAIAAAILIFEVVRQRTATGTLT
jgi:TrmH family RNA methyltransferase